MGSYPLLQGKIHINYSSLYLLHFAVTPPPQNTYRCDCWRCVSGAVPVELFCTDSGGRNSVSLLYELSYAALGFSSHPIHTYITYTCTSHRPTPCESWDTWSFLSAAYREDMGRHLSLWLQRNKTLNQFNRNHAHWWRHDWPIKTPIKWQISYICFLYVRLIDLGLFWTRTGASCCLSPSSLKCKCHLLKKMHHKIEKERYHRDSNRRSPPCNTGMLTTTPQQLTLHSKDDILSTCCLTFLVSFNVLFQGSTLSSSVGAVRTRERFLSSMNSEMGSHLTPVSTIAFTYPALIQDISCTGVKVDVQVKAQLRSQSQTA